MLAFCGFFVFLASVHLDSVDDLFQARRVKVGKSEYQFRVFVPKGFSKKKKWPVMLFLHGAGERGEDNVAQTRVGIGAAIDRQRDTFPFVVVLPQCPKDRWWTEPDMQALALKALDLAMREFNGDGKRTYLTGLSMGGYGSWIMASKNPKKFSALAVVCGGIVPPRGLVLPDSAKSGRTGGDPYAEVASKLRGMPIWLFHGDTDGAVPVTESRQMNQALKAAGADVRYTEYPGVGHNSWDRAYADPEIFSWFLSHHRN